MRDIVKKFKTLPKKAIALAGVGIVGIVVLGVILIANMQPTQPNIALLKEEFTVEYGETFSTVPKDYVKADEEVLKETRIVVSNTKYDDGNSYPKVGTYKAKATYKEEELTFMIVVKDTTNPEFVDFKETLEIEKGKNDYDFVSQYKAEDLSEVTITVDTSKVNFDVVGDYEITVKAEDKYKNKTSKKATVKVKEPIVVVEEDSPVVNEQVQATGTTDTYVPNTNNNTGGGTTNTQPQTNDPAPTVCQFSSWNMVGNSGYANHDWTTANEWGKENVPVGYGYSVYTTKDNCGNTGWTVEWEKLEW